AVAPLVVDDAAVMHGDDADAFGGVHRAAATNGDEAVAALGPILLRAGIDELHARVRLHLVEYDRLDVGAPQRFESGVQESRRLDARVGDEQRPADAEEARLAAELLDRAQALDESSRTLVGAEGVFEHLCFRREGRRA